MKSHVPDISYDLRLHVHLTVEKQSNMKFGTSVVFPEIMTREKNYLKIHINYRNITRKAFNYSEYFEYLSRLKTNSFKVLGDSSM